MIQQLFKNLIDEAVDFLKEHEPTEGYRVAFSGGKDSCVLKELCNMAGVKYDAHYSITSTDPPELIQFIREHHVDVKFDYPGTTMWKLIVKKSYPMTRLVRECCKQLKESGHSDRVTLTGIRWEESSRRAKTRKKYEDAGMLLHPIIDWNEADIWEFIEMRNLPYCKLYDEGFSRLGCIGCPMADKGRLKQFRRWPKYKQMYLRAFARMLEERKRKGLETTKWKTAEDVMEWWLRY